ncbi:MAG: hypothetical protein FWD68_06835 [Alphaproteobacteria bacterium]|nr:hypothetical protein [Alphaproteobacteria bacterium]
MNDKVTYFVIQPFETAEDGRLMAMPAVQAATARAALRRAEALAVAGGALAFSRSGDPSLGDFDDAVILGRFGKIPMEEDDGQ